MLKKSKIIIACILSVFIVALTGTGLWLFLDAGTSGGGNTPGTITPGGDQTPDEPKDIVYQDTNIQRFADVLDKLTKLSNVDPDTPAAGTTYATLGEIKRAYCKQAAYAFSDAKISSDSFYKVIEFVEGLIDDEGFVGFKGTELEGSTILEAYEFDLKSYIDMAELKEYISTMDYNKIASYLVTKFSNLVADMKGGSLAVSSEAGTIRKILDLFFEYTGIKQEDFGKIVYYAVDRFFTTVQEKKTDVENMVNKVLVEQIKKGGKSKEAIEELMTIFSGSLVDIDLSKLTDNQVVAMVEVAVDSWFTAFVAPAQRTWNNMGVDKVSTSVNGMLSTTFGIFNSLNGANLNVLNQVLQQFSKTIVDAQTDEAREAAMIGAIESLTGLAQAKASEIRSRRTLLEDGTYTALYVDENMLNFVKQLENKLIPIAYAVSAAGYFDFNFLKIGLAGGTLLETVQLLTDVVTNGFLNVLDLIGEKDSKGEYSFARQVIQAFVDRQETLGAVEDGGRTIDISDYTSLTKGVDKLIEMFEDYKTAGFIDEETFNSYAGDGSKLSSLKEGLVGKTSVDAVLQKDAGIAIKEAVLALSVAPIIGGMGGDIMGMIQTIIGPIFGEELIVIPSEFPVSTLPEYEANGGTKRFETNHRELAIIVKMLTSFLSGKGVEVTTIIDQDDATNNQSYTLRENGLTGCLENGSVYDIVEQIISYCYVSFGSLGSIFYNSGSTSFEVTGASTAAKYYPTIKYWFGPVSDKYYFYYVDGEDFVRVFFKDEFNEEEVYIYAGLLDDSGITTETTINSVYLRYDSTVLDRTGKTGLTRARLYAQLMYKLFESIPKSFFEDGYEDIQALYNAYKSLGTAESKLQKFIEIFNGTGWSVTTTSGSSRNYYADDLGRKLYEIIDNQYNLDNFYFSGTSTEQLLNSLGRYNNFVAKGNTTNDSECKKITLNKMTSDTVITSESLELYIGDEKEKVGFDISNALLNSFLEEGDQSVLIMSMIKPVIQTLASGFGVEYVKDGVKTPIDLTLKMDEETGFYTNPTFKQIVEQISLPIIASGLNVEKLEGSTFAERKEYLMKTLKDQFNVGTEKNLENYEKRRKLLNGEFEEAAIQFLNAGEYRKKMILATWFEGNSGFNIGNLTQDKYKQYVMAYMNKFADKRYSYDNAYYARYGSTSQYTNYWNYVDSNNTDGTEFNNIIQAWFNEESRNGYISSSLLNFKQNIEYGNIFYNFDAVTRQWNNSYTSDSGNYMDYWGLWQNRSYNTDMYNTVVDQRDLEAWWLLNAYETFSPAYAAYYNEQFNTWIENNKANFGTMFGDNDLYKEYIDLPQAEKEQALNEQIEQAYEYIVDNTVEYLGPGEMNILRFGDAITPILFYFFEIPQEADNGNTRLSQVATATLGIVLPYIMNLIGIIGG